MDTVGENDKVVEVHDLSDGMSVVAVRTVLHQILNLAFVNPSTCRCF